VLEVVDLGLNPDSYRQFAKSQIEYALENCGRNFVCGFSNNQQTHLHHRSM